MMASSSTINIFSFAMFLAPLIALFLEPKHTVVFIILQECAMGVVFIVKEKLNFEVKHIFVGSFSGIIAGIFLFGLLSQRIVGFVIGVSVLTFSILFLLNINFKIIVIDFVTLGSFSASGYVTANLLILLVCSVPFLILSYIAGTYILKFVNPEKLKRIILVTTLFAGILAIWKFVPWGKGVFEENFLCGGNSQDEEVYIIRGIRPHRFFHITLFLGALL
jgi:hypothetical protein